MSDDFRSAAAEDSLSEAPDGPARSGFWRKLKSGLRMTHTEVLERLDAAVSGRTVLDEETLEYLEEALIATDVGVETALELVESLRADAQQCHYCQSHMQSQCPRRRKTCSHSTARAAVLHRPPALLRVQDSCCA